MIRESLRSMDRRRAGRALVAVLFVAFAIASYVAAPARAGDRDVAPKIFDLTKGWQVPAAGDTVATGPTSTPSNGAITLVATAGLRTACVYSPIIDLTAPMTSDTQITGPAKGVAGMNLWASQASGTVGVSCTALYGVAPSLVTTPADLSSTTADDSFSFYADSYTGHAAQTDKTAIQWYTNLRPRNARYVRFLLQNKGGVALTIPAGGWRYISP